jgi:hypothetical protein
LINPLLSGLCTNQLRQLRQRCDLAIRLSRQPFRPLVVTVHHTTRIPKAEAVYASQALEEEQDRAGRDRKPIDVGMKDLGW